MSRRGRRRNRQRPATAVPRSLRGALIVIALVAVVTAVAGIPYLIASDDAKRPPAEPQLTALELPEGYSLEMLERARVVDIIDGDTIDVRIDGQLWRVRYFGVDTPERGQRCFREATDRNTMLAGSTVLLLPDEREEDPFGRLLRYVFMEDGTSIDATLVAEGFGEAWRRDGHYRDQIVALEEEARAEGRGCLWK